MLKSIVCLFILGHSWGHPEVHPLDPTFPKITLTYRQCKRCATWLLTE